jgi:preprotein translocase subunit SecF
MNNIENRIGKIEERNNRVEMDKAWEISWTRKVLIAITTYIVVVVFFIIAKLSDPFSNALVATLGFLLSTLTISFGKKIWIERQK